ncbi:hypothetical protein AMATHDRAFT_54307 [Amanita thiersii Skay4041]|uniref:mitogen-activated protein kinase kinase n=1 Tax=Amanita thiersii Skay4041 TaxID=703135 RepID=A0A2A9NZ47_9AGAR|nr:hypothetical protein AMATHDRAFT_54307 [Amanita thiersii Skay4041]
MGPRNFKPTSSHSSDTPPLAVGKSPNTTSYPSLSRPQKSSPAHNKPNLPPVLLPVGNPTYYNGSLAQQEPSEAAIRHLTPSPPARPKLSLSKIPVGNLEYYNGPSVQPESEDIITVRPEVNQATLVPQGPIGDIRSLLDNIRTRHDNHPDPDHDDVRQLPTTITVNTNYTDDDFELIELIGEGTGGVVHKVLDKGSQKIMARKTITTREAPTRQLLRELSIISSNKHANIINFFGAYMSPSTSEVKILMECCEGGSLEAVCKQIKERGAVVGELIAARLGEGVLQGLAYLHSKKTIHRDIKPSNILITLDGVVKLCDFGVSGELVDSLAGTFTGTSMYMAPERISGHEYTIRSDVWSMGISLLELAQNRFPFPSDLPAIDLMMHITHGEPPRLEDEGEVKWSDEMKDFIKQTLIHDQARRPIPKEMLKHPWIVKAMREDNQMAKWIRLVWGKKMKKNRENGSRPTSGRADNQGSQESH